jgi:hypothetical protein
MIPTSFVIDGVRYYQQGRRCGKRTCKCAAGQLHGPYWYARPTGNRRTKKRYIGTELPAEIIRAILPQQLERQDERVRDWLDQCEV